MKYWFISFIIAAMAYCQNNRATLPREGVWINQKYPAYLRALHSFRRAQDAVYIKTVTFKREEPMVWVKFRSGDAEAFSIHPAGKNQWALRQDSGPAGISLEMNAEGRCLRVANDRFSLVEQQDEHDIAFQFLASNYLNGTKTVVFSQEGRIVGLDQFTAFKPVVDYSHEPGEGDRIWLLSGAGQWEKFGLKIVGPDLIEIYALEQDKFGSLMYQLTRRAPFVDAACIGI